LFAARMIWKQLPWFLLLLGWNAYADQPLEHLMEATFRLADNEHSGTCFLVSLKEPDPAHPRRVILATAAHVLEQMGGDECEIILRIKKDDGSFTRYAHTLSIRKEGKPAWTRHPDVDIATMFFNLPIGVWSYAIPYEQVVDEARVIDRTVKVGREAWIPCYPAKLEANDAGWPVVRHGSVASHPLTPVKSVRTLLIDYKNFGGDSGAPVAVIVDDRPLIIGVVSGMHRQTDRSTLPFEERVMHTPLGLSIVTQGPYLRETVELMGK
jgi:hypothetical protein